MWGGGRGEGPPTSSIKIGASEDIKRFTLWLIKAYFLLVGVRSGDPGASTLQSELCFAGGRAPFTCSFALTMQTFAGNMALNAVRRLAQRASGASACRLSASAAVPQPDMTNEEFEAGAPPAEELKEFKVYR